MREIPAERHATQLRIYKHRPVTIVPGQSQQACLPGLKILQPDRKFGNRFPGTPRNPFKNIACGGKSGFNAGFLRMNRPATTPHTPGISCVLSLIAMMQVEVPTTFTTSPVRAPAPMASQCASNAPTGMGIPCFNPNFFAHSALRYPRSCRWSGIVPPALREHLLREGRPKRGIPQKAILRALRSTAICDPLRRSTAAYLSASV